MIRSIIATIKFSIGLIFESVDVGIRSCSITRYYQKFLRWKKNSIQFNERIINKLANERTNDLSGGDRP